MAHQQIIFITRRIGSIFNVSNRCISISSIRNLDQRWREKRGLPLNPNANGVLTDGPDYSFLDGRPIPYGVGQKNRLLKQKKIVETIKQLSGEIDFAVERHKRLEMEKEETEKKIIKDKLKPKGLLLLKKKS